MDTVSPSDALAALLAATPPLRRSETVTLAAARGRVLDRAVVSLETLPALPRSAMDGYALRAADTVGTASGAPVLLRVAGEVLMGQPAPREVQVGEAFRIHTGALVPEGADAVVMVEDTTVEGDAIALRAAVPAGDNVLVPGEDVRAGAVAIAAGTRLGPAELGGLAALGQREVGVRARPRIAILSTGDEVVPLEAQPGVGQVRDVNAHALAALVEAAGGEALLGGIVGDDAADLARRCAALLADADGLVVSAGSSVSHRDVTARAFAALGATILAHGIAVRPGRPAIVASRAGKPVLGLPGNPASALVVGWRLLRPLVRHLAGERDVALGIEGALLATLAAELPSRIGREDFIPCRLDRSAQPPRALPLLDESNLVFTLIRSDGLAVVPLACAGLRTGEQVSVVVL